MRKPIALLIVICLILTLAFTLIACVEPTPPAPPTPPEIDKPVDPDEPVDPPDPDDPNRIYLTINEVFDLMGKSFSAQNKETISFITAIDIEVGQKDEFGGHYDKPYMACFNGNISATGQGSELYFSVNEKNTLTDADLSAINAIQDESKRDAEKIKREKGKTVVGLIIVDNKMFIEIENTKIYLENMDINYIVKLITTILPIIPAELDKLLSGIGFSIDMIIELVVPMLFSYPVTYFDGEKYDISFEVTISALLDFVIGIVKGLNIDSLLQGAGVKLPDGVSISGIIDMIKIPPFYINVNTQLDFKGYSEDGQEILANKFIDLTIQDAMMDNIIHLHGCASMNSDKQDIGIPTNLAEYDPFSITHMQFDVGLMADVGNGKNLLDVGKLVNSFAGKTFLPEGSIFVRADIEITLKFQFDINLNKNSENMILIEAYSGNDTSIKSKRLVGIYFLNNEILVNIDQITPIYQGKNIKIITGMDITGKDGLLTGYLEMLTELIDKALKDLVGTDKAEGQSVAHRNGYNGGDLILAMSATETGDLFSEGGLLNFINSVLGMVSFDKFVVLTEDNGIVIQTFEDNDPTKSSIFDVIANFAPDIKVTLDNMKNMIGAAKIAIKMKNFNVFAIEEISIEWKQCPELGIGLNVQNMRFGFAPENLKENILEATKDKEYVSNIKDIIADIMKGVDIKADMKIHIPEGKHNILSIIKNLGIPSLELPFDGAILDIPAGGLTLDVQLIIQFQFDPSDYEKVEGQAKSQNSKLKIEIWNKKKFLYFNEGLLLGMYAQGNKAYMDLSGIELYGMTLPRVSLSMDILGLLSEQLNKIDIDLILKDLLKEILPKDASQGKIDTASDSRRNGARSGDLNDRICVEVNEDSFKLKITGIALSKLLEAFDIKLTLPNFDVRFEVIELKNISLNIGLDISPGSALTIDAKLETMVLGKALEIEMPDFDKQDYFQNLNDFVKGAIDKALSGISIDFNLKLTLPSGKFAIGAMLSNLGVVGIEDFVLQVGDPLNPQDVVLDCKLLFRAAFVKDNPKTKDVDESKKSKLSVEIILNESIMGIKAGKLIGVYSNNGKLYIDLSGLRIDEMPMPRLSVNIDVPSLLIGMMEKIDLDSLLEPILKKNGLIPAGKEESGSARRVADTYALAPEDYPILKLNENSIAIIATSKAIEEILKLAGLNLTGLPNFTANIEISAINGLKLEFNDCALLSLDLSITNIEIGVPVEIPMDGVDDKNFPSSITQVINDTVTKVLSGTQATFGIKLTVNPMIIYLDDIFKLLDITLGGDGENLYAINITETLILDLEFKVRFQYNEDHPLESLFALDIFLKHDFFLQAGGNIPAGKLISIYGIEGKTYVDMSGLKLGDAKLPKVVLNVDIMSLLAEQIKELLKAENLDKILNDKIGSIGGGGDKISAVNDSVIVDGKEPTIIIKQDALGLKITSMALFNLLSSFGVDFSLPFDFDLSLDLELGEIKNGLTIAIKTDNEGLSEALYDFEGSIFIGDFKFGRNDVLTVEDVPNGAEKDRYNQSLKDALTEAMNNLLDGTTLTAGLKLTLYAKDHNISDYLKLFIDTNMMADLHLNIQQDQTLDLRMEFKFRSRAHEKDGVINPRGMSLELFLTKAPLFIGDLVYDPYKPVISIIADPDGKTYLDLSNLVLSAHQNGSVKKGVRLPKIAININVMEAIDQLMTKLDTVDDLFNKLIEDLTKPKAEEKSGGARVNDTPLNPGDGSNEELEYGKYLDLNINDKRVEIAVTAEAVAMILGMVGLTIELPPITLEGSLDVGSADQPNSNGFLLDVKLYGIGDTNLRKPIANIDVYFKDIRIGEHVKVNIKQLTQEEKNEFSPTLNSGLQDGLKNILTGADLSANFEIRLPAGRYNISKLLGAFDVDAGIIPITLPEIEFTSAVNIVLKLSFIVETFDPKNSANNKFVLKLTLLEDLIPYVLNGGEKSAVIKAGTDLFKIFAVGDNKTYIDLSGLTFANVSLPRIYLDIDVLNLLNMLIEAQDLDLLLKDYLDTVINKSEDGGNKNENAGGGSAETVADGEIIKFPIDITLAQKYIKFTATSKALFQLLEGFGLDIELPKALSFDITGQLNGFGVYDPNSLELVVNLNKFDQLEGDLDWVEGKYMAKVKLSLGKLNFDAGAKIPEEELQSLVKSAEAIRSESGDRLKFAIYDLIKTLDLEIGLKLNLAQTKVSLTKLLNTILASSNQYIDLPINLALDNIEQDLKLVVKWNLDFRKHENSEAYIMIYTEDLKFEIRVVYKNNTLYIDLSRLGLLQVKVNKFNLTALIDSILSDMLPVLNTDITNMLMNLLFPNNNNGDNNDDNNSEILGMNNTQKATNNDFMSAVGQQTELQSGINEAANKVDIMDILSILIGSLKIQDLIATIGLDNSALSGMLAQIGVGLGVPLSAEGGVYLPEGGLMLDIGIAGNEIGMALKINKLGGSKRYIDWLYFTDRFLLHAENPRVTAPENLPKQKEPSELVNYFMNHGDYSLLSGYDFVMSIFTSLRRDDDPSFGAEGQQAVLKLNLQNMSQASMSLGDGGGYISARIFRVTDYSRTINGKYNARRGSIVIELYKGYDVGRVIVFVVIDSVNGVIQIIGTPNLFKAGSDLLSGNLVSVPIYANLAQSIGGLLDPIIKLIPPGVYGGGTTGTPTSDGVEAMAEGDLPFDIMGMIKDITLTIMESGAVRIFADLEATVLNDMLIDMLDNLFLTLSGLYDLIGHNNPLNIPYKATLDSSSYFFNEFWEKMLKPLVAKNVSGALNDLGLTNLVRGQIEDVVKRILPLARFDRMNLTVNILDGKLADAAIMTQRKIPGRYYDPNNLPEIDDAASWDKERLQIELYNLQASEQVEWSRMDTAGGVSIYNQKNYLPQSTSVIYDPYAESNGEIRDPSNLASQFVTGARRFSLEQSRYGTEGMSRGTAAKSKVTWHVMNPNTKGYTKLAAQPVDNPALLYKDTAYNSKIATYRNNSKAFNEQILNSAFATTYGTVDRTTGAIVYTLKGVAESFQYKVDGTTYTSEIEVNLTVLPKSNDLSSATVEDVMVAEHGELPNVAMLGMNVELPGGEIIRVKRAVNTVIKNAGRRKPYAEDDIIIKDAVTPANGPHIVVGGQNIGVTVHYVSSKVEGYNRVITIDAYGKNDFTTTLPSRMYFAYANGVYNSALVEWDTRALEELTLEQWQEGTPSDRPIILKARILHEINLGSGGADTRQEVEFEVHIRSTKPHSVDFKGELFNNTVSIDPFDIIENKKGLADPSALFPNVATVKYLDGHIDQQEVEWFEITEQGNYVPISQALLDMICTPNGGEYKNIIAVRNRNGDIQWKHVPITLNALRRVPTYVKFGSNTDGSDIKTLTINPYDALLNGIDKVMPQRVQVVFEQGDTRMMDVAWDTSKIEITPLGGTYLVPITIAPNTSLERKFTVPVKVLKMQIVGLAYENNTYVFDNAPEILYGGKTLEEFKPKTLKVISSDGQIFEVPARVDFDNVDININGINTYATAVIGDGEYKQEFMFNVVVPKPEIIGVEAGYEDFWIEMDEIRTQGFNAYPKIYKVKFAHYQGTTIIRELPISGWNLSQTSTIMRETMIIDGNSYNVEIPGAGGIMYGKVADGNGANAQYVPVNLKIAQNVKNLGTASKKIVIDYATNPTGQLPNKLFFNVDTIKINNLGAKTTHNYDREFAVEWNVGDYNFLDKTFLEVIVQKGSRYEARFNVEVEVRNAPTSGNVRLKSNQNVTFTYQDFVKLGEKALPDTLYWEFLNASNNVISTKAIATNWTMSDVSLKNVDIINGVANLDVNVYFGRENSDIISGRQRVVITNIPTLVDSSVNTNIDYDKFKESPSSVFPSNIKVGIMQGGQQVLIDQRVTYNIAKLNNDLAANESLDIPAKTISSQVTVIINSGTIYEVRYTVNVTVNNITQQN